MGRKTKHTPSIVLSDDETPAGPILDVASASYGEAPPSLERDENHVCDSTPDDDNAKEEEEEAPPVPEVKKKRQLTPKQIEALTAGRNKGLEIKKQNKEATVEKNEILTKVKELKIKEKIEGKKDEVEDLKRYVDSHELRKHVADLNNKFDSISTQFNSYLSEKQQRKADKVANVLENTVRDAVPRAVSKIIYEDRLRQEQNKYNPYMGRV